MANSETTIESTTAKDVKQLGIWAALGSLSYVFWICGGMEMVERLAFYGVRQVSSLYATDSVSNGGLGLVGTEVGTIFVAWALMQSFVPVLTGGISDRVGYKEARLEHRRKVDAGEIQEESLWRDSLKELGRPIMIWYTVLFSGTGSIPMSWCGKFSVKMEPATGSGNSSSA